MKKILTVTALLLVFALLLSACDMDLTPQAEPYIRQMLTALSTGDADAAKALLHPDRVDEDTGDLLRMLTDLMAGREVERCTQTGINMRSQMAGTGGAYREESGTVQVSLTDGTTLVLSYTYLSNDTGDGFTAFRFMVGI